VENLRALAPVSCVLLKGGCFLSRKAFGIGLGLGCQVSICVVGIVGSKLARLNMVVIYCLFRLIIYILMNLLRKNFILP
jgi:hypothetical protein